jgi:hypothetical protein
MQKRRPIINLRGFVGCKGKGIREMIDPAGAIPPIFSLVTVTTRVNKAPSHRPPRPPTMPRPKRKLKKFTPKPPAQEDLQPIPSPPLLDDVPPNPPSDSLDVTSIPAHEESPPTEILPINDFGFSQVRGIKRTIISIPSDSDVDQLPPPDDPQNDSDEDTPVKREYPPSDAASSSTLSACPTPSPKKRAVPKVRTSELIHRLPIRRKRIADPPSSDEDVPVRRAKGKSGKKRPVAVEDKENEGPSDGGDGKEWAVEVKGRFAEIDRWEMEFESVDLSFSSQ